MSGETRIVVTAAGQEYCDVCYSDLDDPTMFVQERTTEGCCECCGVEVVAGDMFDMV